MFETLKKFKFDKPSKSALIAFLVISLILAFIVYFVVK